MLVHPNSEPDTGMWLIVLSLAFAHGSPDADAAGVAFLPISSVVYDQASILTITNLNLSSALIVNETWKLQLSTFEPLTPSSASLALSTTPLHGAGTLAPVPPGLHLVRFRTIVDGSGTNTTQTAAPYPGAIVWLDLSHLGYTVPAGAGRKLYRLLGTGPYEWTEEYLAASIVPVNFSESEYAGIRKTTLSSAEGEFLLVESHSAYRYCLPGSYGCGCGRSSDTILEGGYLTVYSIALILFICGTLGGIDAEYTQWQDHVSLKCCSKQVKGICRCCSCTGPYHCKLLCLTIVCCGREGRKFEAWPKDRTPPRPWRRCFWAFTQSLSVLVYIILVAHLLPQDERHPDSWWRCHGGNTFSTGSIAIGIFFLSVYVGIWWKWGGKMMCACCSNGPQHEGLGPVGPVSSLWWPAIASFSMGIALLAPLSALGPRYDMWYTETIILSAALLASLGFCIGMWMLSFLGKDGCTKSSEAFDIFNIETSCGAFVYFVVYWIYVLGGAAAMYSVYNRGLSYPCGNNFYGECPE